MEAREEWQRDHQRDLDDAARDAERGGAPAVSLTCAICERTTLTLQRIIDPETDAYVYACPECVEEASQAVAQRQAEHDAEYHDLDRISDQLRGL